MSYIENQVSRIKTDGEYLPTITISDCEGNKTNTVYLSNENAKEIAEWILKNFVSEKSEIRYFTHET